MGKTKTTKCHACGSPAKRNLTVTEQEYAGTEDGREYTHVVRKWVRCVGCGQTRIDRSYRRK